MKIYSRTIFLLIAVLLTFSFAVNAQTSDKPENVKESLGTQFKKNTVPGLRYAPGTGSTVKTSTKPGNNTVSTQVSKNQTMLASDKKPESKKEETKAVKPVIPTQENIQEDSKKEQNQL